LLSRGEEPQLRPQTAHVASGREDQERIVAL
jgi:hypothetical protein